MSNSVAVQQLRYVKLAPSNNSSSFGPKSSQPVIRFSLAAMQANAQLKDARLNFTFTPNTDGAGALPAYTDDFNVDPVVSLSSIMDQVIISSRQFGTTLEQVVNIGRLESAFYRSQKSPKMMACHHYHLGKAVGLGRYNRYSGSFPRGGALTAQTRTDVRYLALRKAALRQAVQCSVPFHSGIFLQDQALDLSASGGLELAIFLQRGEAMFFGAAGGTNPPTATSTYTLSDVSLTVPVLYKSAAMIAATPPQSVIEFLNWTSIYSVIDSTQASIAQRLYFSGLVSSVHNMLPTSQMNSVNFNQYALKNPVVQKLTFLRDGLRNPLEKQTLVQGQFFLELSAVLWGVICYHH